MATSDQVAETTETLARSGVGIDDGVDEILKCCGDKRVSVVAARRRFEERMQQNPSDDVAPRAVELLDAVLDRGAWS